MAAEGARTVTLAGPCAARPCRRVDDVAVHRAVDDELLERRSGGPEATVPQARRANGRLGCEWIADAAISQLRANSPGGEPRANRLERPPCTRAES